MMRSGPFFRSTALSLAILTSIAGFPLRAAKADMVATQDLLPLSLGETVDEQRAGVLSFLAREDVRRHLDDMGVDPDEAAMRVASLSDAEIAEIAGRIETDPAGQSVGAVIGAAVLIFIILLITDIAGLTDVFSFVRK
jgi:hypothetical protein